MPKDAESLSVVSVTCELVMRFDLLLEDEDEYLEYEPSPTGFIVELESSYL